MNSTNTQARPGHYLDTRNVHTYYEVTGEGEPVVLLHGGMCTAETFDSQVGALANSYGTYVPERRGHGRTPDVSGPITYDIMADDTIAFMETVGITSAHVVGWSDGAFIGLLIAMRRPDLVRKLVYIGEPINFAGAAPNALQALIRMTPDQLPPILQQLYSAVSPDGPEHFPVVAAKMIDLWHVDHGISLEELGRVAAPTLVMLGDDDLITTEHAAAMHQALPNAQLAVVPGTSHMLLMEKPDLANRIILDFLADEQTPKMMPRQALVSGPAAS